MKIFIYTSLCFLVLFRYMINCGGSGGSGSGGGGSKPSEPPTQLAVIVAGSQSCNPNWTPKNIKNNTTDQTLKVVVKKTTQINGQPPSSETSVIDMLAAKEERPLGCEGCGLINSSQVCTTYEVLSAVKQ